MVIPLFPGVTGLKVENAWGRGARGRVRCTARLSRALTKDESERLERFLNISIEGNELVRDCRLEEVEEWHARLVDVLAGRRVFRERRVAACSAQRRRPPKADPPPPRPDSAA